MLNSSMKRQTKLFLVHLPRVKEPFSDNLSEAFGFWDPLCLGQMTLYRSIPLLKEGLDYYIRKNNHVDYILTNEIPSQEEYGISEEMYKILFGNAKFLDDRYLKELN